MWDRQRDEVWGEVAIRLWSEEWGEEKREERRENDLGLGLKSGEAMRRILYSLISSWVLSEPHGSHLTRTQLKNHQVKLARDKIVRTWVEFELSHELKFFNAALTLLNQLII
jgi:hypothetical protein